jgi:cytochrome c oxidase subunit 1
MAQAPAATHGAAAHDAHHEELGFWRKYVFSVDHKVIGIQYAVTGLVFLLFGFSLMMLMRWQLAYPGKALPILGALFGAARMPDGTMLPEFYNELGAMHGTIMCRSRWAASETSCCRCRSARPTWLFRASTWRAIGATSSAAA